MCCWTFPRRTSRPIRIAMPPPAGWHCCSRRSRSLRTNSRQTGAGAFSCGCPAFGFAAPHGVGAGRSSTAGSARSGRPNSAAPSRPAAHRAPGLGTGRETGGADDHDPRTPRGAAEPVPPAPEPTKADQSTPEPRGRRRCGLRRRRLVPAPPPLLLQPRQGQRRRAISPRQVTAIGTREPHQSSRSIRPRRPNPGHGLWPSPSIPRLAAARAALANGRIDDARRLLQEAQLQLVFRPVNAADEDPPLVGKGAVRCGQRAGGAQCERRSAQPPLHRYRDGRFVRSSKFGHGGHEFAPSGIADACCHRLRARVSAALARNT